jgi:hypothetical protein
MPNPPYELYRATVVPEWIDYNGHMNVAYYVLASLTPKSCAKAKRSRSRPS